MVESLSLRVTEWGAFKESKSTVMPYGTATWTTHKIQSHKSIDKSVKDNVVKTKKESANSYLVRPCISLSNGARAVIDAMRDISLNIEIKIFQKSMMVSSPVSGTG